MYQQNRQCEVERVDIREKPTILMPWVDRPHRIPDWQAQTPTCALSYRMTMQPIGYHSNRSGTGQVRLASKNTQNYWHWPNNFAKTRWQFDMQSTVTHKTTRIHFYPRNGISFGEKRGFWLICEIVLRTVYCLKLMVQQYIPIHISKTTITARYWCWWDSNN